MVSLKNQVSLGLNPNETIHTHILLAWKLLQERHVFGSCKFFLVPLEDLVPCICSILELHLIMLHGIRSILEQEPFILHGFCSILELDILNLHGICTIFSIVEVQLHCRDRTSHSNGTCDILEIQNRSLHMAFCSILDMIFAACWNFNLRFCIMCAEMCRTSTLHFAQYMQYCGTSSVHVA